MNSTTLLVSFSSFITAAPILRSCEELRLASYRTDGYYDIDPDGINFGQPVFTVYCEMDNGNDW